MLREIKKVLVIKLRDIGDIVLSTPVLKILYKNCNAPEIVYVVKKEYGDFKYLLPYVSEVITYDKSNPFDFLRVVFKLRKYRFDLAVNLHATFRSALITLLSGAKLWLVHNHSGKNYFTSLPLNIEEKQKSIIERDVDTLSPLIDVKNIGEELKKTQLILKYEFSKLFDEEEFLNTIGFGIGAKRKEKIWDKKKFIELGWKLKEKNFKIAIFCAENERKDGEFIANALGKDTKLFVGLDFVRLAYFLKKLVLFIGNDSGLRHIAAALGIKTITLFGPENPVEWHPYKESDGHFSISHLEDLKNEGYNVLSREFREKSKIAIERITVDEVYEITKKVLRI